MCGSAAVNVDVRSVRLFSLCRKLILNILLSRASENKAVLGSIIIVSGDTSIPSTLNFDSILMFIISDFSDRLGTHVEAKPFDVLIDVRQSEYSFGNFLRRGLIAVNRSRQELFDDKHFNTEERARGN